MKARNRLASRNLVAELIRCANDHSAMFSFAVRSRSRHLNSQTSGPPCRSVRIMLPFCMDFPFCAFNARNCRGGLAGTIQAQIVDEEWQEPQRIEQSYCFPAEITSANDVKSGEHFCGTTFPMADARVFRFHNLRNALRINVCDLIVSMEQAAMSPRPVIGAIVVVSSLAVSFLFMAAVRASRAG